jgi:hypothetical protein
MYFCAGMPSQPPVAGEQLHALVVAAADGAEAESRALLQATLPLLVEYVAAVLVDKDDGQTAPEKLTMRNERLGEAAHRVIGRGFLAEWRQSPAKDAWRFLESRVQQFAAVRRDLDSAQ